MLAQFHQSKAQRTMGIRGVVRLAKQKNRPNGGFFLRSGFRHLEKVIHPYTERTAILRSYDNALGGKAEITLHGKV